MSDQTLNNLKLSDLKHVHIVGVCGTLMGAFAAFLRRRGIKVTGSDQNVYPPMSDVLKNAGVVLFSGYDVANLTREGRPDLVVIGNVISRSNPEAAGVMLGDIPYSSLPEAMERLLLKNTRNMVVAGTHGKTTTSSLLAFTLVHIGRDPNYFIGGVAHDLPYSFNVSSIDDARPFVLEGDEYDTAFWDKVPKFNHYLPDDVILTSVEFDHADIYANLAAVVSAFSGLLTRIRSGGRLIACIDYPEVKNLIASKIGLESTLTYGKDEASGADYFPMDLKVVNGKTEFTVMKKSVNGYQKDARFSMHLSGHHNAMNALAVWMLCSAHGYTQDQVQAAWNVFQGIKRRQEVRGEIKGVLVMDDFAHHPTAVKETLRAIRSKYPDRRLVTVFEPRSATSRRKVFQKEYALAFDEADAVFIAAPYDQSKIIADDQFSSEQLMQDIRESWQERGLKSKKSAQTFADVTTGVRDVSSFTQQGDLVAVLSNGGFEGFIPKLLADLAQG